MNDKATSPLPPHLFAGLQVLDLTRVMSGPFCTSMLADLGAEVIKIEMPGFGEEGRHFAPHVNGESTYFALLNRGKKSVTINLKSPEGIALIRDLARQADVLVENFRPGVMDRLGLSTRRLASGQSVLDRRVDLRIRTKRPLRRLAGFRSRHPGDERPDERDRRARTAARLAVGESIADVATGMFAAWGIAAALYDRERTGIGRKLEVAMLDSVFSMLLTSLSRRLFTDQPTRRVGNRHPETYPVDSFATKDWRHRSGWIFRLPSCAALAKPSASPALVDDPRFKTNADRNAHEAELRDLIAALGGGTHARTRRWRRLRAADVPAAPVWSLDELIESGHPCRRAACCSRASTPNSATFAWCRSRSNSAAPERICRHGRTDARRRYRDVLADKLGLDATNSPSLRVRQSDLTSSASEICAVLTPSAPQRAAVSVPRAATR